MAANRSDNEAVKGGLRLSSACQDQATAFADEIEIHRCTMFDLEKQEVRPPLTLSYLCLYFEKTILDGQGVGEKTLLFGPVVGQVSIQE